MKRFILFIILILFNLNIFCFNNSVNSNINKLIRSLKDNGVYDICLIYDWGDGIKEEFDIRNYKQDIKHNYEYEGEYLVKVFLKTSKQGETKKFLINKKTVDYKKERIKYDLKVDIPKEIKQGTKIKLFADLLITEPDIIIKQDNSKEKLIELLGISPEQVDLKNINNKFFYHWYIDEAKTSFEEGNPAYHRFDIPNGPVKPYYNIKLKIFFSYAFNDKNEKKWNPMVIEKNFRIVVTKSPEYKLLDYSKILKIKENSFISPLFFSLRDDSYYNDEYYYKSTIIFNRPVIYIDDKAYPTKYVSLKKHDKNRDYFNEILYMLDMDKVSVRLKKRNGRAYFLATLKISTPSGIYERKMPVFVKKEE